MLLAPDDFEEQTLLEDAEPEDLRNCLLHVRRMMWDEEQFTSKVCQKLKVATSERSSLASFASASCQRRNKLKLLEQRLQTLVDEASGLHNWSLM